MCLGDAVSGQVRVLTSSLIITGSGMRVLQKYLLKSLCIILHNI